MAKYNYNGNILPALPTLDKQYALIVKRYPSGGGTEYWLHMSDSKVTTQGSDGGFVELNTTNLRYVSNGESWESKSTGTATETLWVVWANYDVYTTDGTLYLAATDPIPVGTITDPLTYMAGYNWMKAMMAKRKRKPIGYSYNGVVLPELPELDDEKKKKYPYVVMGRPLGISVCFASKPAYYNTTQLGGCIDFETGTEMIQYNVGRDYADEYEGDYYWVYVASNPTTWGENSSYGEGVWTNTDIYKDDGTIYLAASDPVPVYE